MLENGLLGKPIDVLPSSRKNPNSSSSRRSSRQSQRGSAAAQRTSVRVVQPAGNQIFLNPRAFSLIEQKQLGNSLKIAPPPPPPKLVESTDGEVKKIK